VGLSDLSPSEKELLSQLSKDAWEECVKWACGNTRLADNMVQRLFDRLESDVEFRENFIRTAFRGLVTEMLDELGRDSEMN
jgi:hypothetical protein